MEFSKVADFGGIMVTRKKRSSRPKRVQVTTLPAPEPMTESEPVNMEDVQPLQLQGKSNVEPKQSGFLASVSGLFSSPESNPQPSQSEKAGSIESQTASSAPVAPDVQAQLSKVPDVIGDEDEAGAVGELANADTIGSMMDSVAFDEQDVKDALTEGFAWLAEHFESEHWKLSERQARLLGKPTAQLANVAWGKLKEILPNIIGNWCEQTPGAAAFIGACAIVVGPKVMKQIALSRSKGNSSKQTPADSAAKLKAIPEPKSQAPVVGIPVATGMIGGEA